MKAGSITGHQSRQYNCFLVSDFAKHSLTLLILDGNMDAGDFVLDALGQRWAGELCHDDYLSKGYFSGEEQNSPRWLYYRCRTEGQNTLLYNGSNQLVDTAPSTWFATTGDVQEITSFHEESAAAVYWISDLSTTTGTIHKRGLRMINVRKQILIQDELSNATASSQWRMHTTASITLLAGDKIAGELT